MNRGNIRDLARKRLGEMTAVFWTDDELNDWINFAGHDVAYKTRCIQRDGYITTTEDISNYTLTTYFPTIIGVTDVYMNKGGTSWAKLDERTRKEMDLLDEGWFDFESSTPQNYIFERERSNALTLSPPPNADNAGIDYVHIYYAIDYTDLSNDDAVPAGLNQVLQLAMSDFVTAYGYESRGYLTKAREMWSNYGNKLANYMAITDKEVEADSDMVMKPYRNI